MCSSHSYMKTYSTAGDWSSERRIRERCIESKVVECWVACGSEQRFLVNGKERCSVVRRMSFESDVQSNLGILFSSTIGYFSDWTLSWGTWIEHFIYLACCGLTGSHKRYHIYNSGTTEVQWYIVRHRADPSRPCQSRQRRPLSKSKQTASGILLDIGLRRNI